MYVCVNINFKFSFSQFWQRERDSEKISLLLKMNNMNATKIGKWHLVWLNSISGYCPNWKACVPGRSHFPDTERLAMCKYRPNYFRSVYFEENSDIWEFIRNVLVYTLYIYACTFFKYCDSQIKLDYRTNF